MYNPNFDTSLRFEKALELLNKFAEHEIVSEGNGEEIYYCNCEINEETKNLLCNLGVRTHEMNYYDEEDGFFDLIEIWGNIQSHYGHDIYYTGEKFVVRDKEKEELLKALKDAVRTLDYIINCDSMDVAEVMYETRKPVEEYKKLIARMEGDES